MEKTTSVSLYQLGWTQSKTYLMATLFVAGNIVLPQLCHLVPQGGLILLPIYFFTLLGAYKYGYTVGLLTAVFSPVVNNLLFGMPATTMLAPILTKSVLLAVAAAFVAQRSHKATIPCIAVAVVACQLLGSLAEWGMTGSASAALQDVRLGIPGMLLQVFGVWALLKVGNNNEA